ncbi:sigma-54 interaction domain-containing protein [Planococcus sp. 1R117A]|uniref:sigma-54 interaction domain-containing protein n=1 Tax=Planococcus sp. 1R117A TaxID=3447020 RepID=UPI003EDB9A48
MNKNNDIIYTLKQLIDGQKFHQDELIQTLFVLNAEDVIIGKFDLKKGKLSADKIDLDIEQFMKFNHFAKNESVVNCYPRNEQGDYIYMAPVNSGKVFDHHLVCLSPIADSANLLQLLTVIAELLNTKLVTYRTVESDFLASDIQSQLCENFSEGYITINKDEMVMYVNKMGTDILDEKAENITGKKLSECMELSIDPLEPLQTGVGWSEREVYAKTHKGRLHLVTTAIPINSAPGEYIGVILLFKEIKSVRKKLNDMVGANAAFQFEQILYRSPEMNQLIHQAKISAQNEANILIEGESGTGKEMVAQAIHNYSNRSKGPFVAIDCSSIPRDLVESELFGYIEGAFTGAIKGGRMGKFELANGGTIFLDEIGEMPLEMQARLLRVIQSRQVVRVGSNEQLPIDIRIISATNRNLEEEVEKKNFRLDLFYRLNVIQLSVPPLRKRNHDILLLAQSFVQKASAREMKKQARITPSVVEVLENYSWPGNVRELENVIERAVVLSDDVIDLVHLPERLHRQELSAGKQEAHLPADFLTPTISASLKEVEINTIIDAVNSCKGNITLAAKKLGISRTTVYKRLKQFDYDFDPTARLIQQKNKNR